MSGYEAPPERDGKFLEGYSENMNTETQTSAAVTAHTPGPWIVQHGMVWTRFDNVRDDRLSACICDPNEGSLESGALLPHAEQLANARLIAAAPDMLKTLQEIAEGKGRFSRDPLTHAINTIDDMKALALAAIAAATDK